MSAKTEKVKTGSLHFSIGDPGEIVNMIRQAYWMEEGIKWAFDTLRCFQGMTLDQSQMILEGNATLMSDDGVTVEFVEKVDKEFKTKLEEWKVFREGKTKLIAKAKMLTIGINKQISWWNTKRHSVRPYVEVDFVVDLIERDEVNEYIEEISEWTDDEFMNWQNVEGASVESKLDFVNKRIEEIEDESNLNKFFKDGLGKEPELTDEVIEIGGRILNKSKLEYYAGFIVKRLRDSIRTPGLMLAVDPLVLHEYEIKRRDLHNEICVDAGFPTRDIDDSEFKKFDDAINKYVDEKAGRLM